MQIWPSILPKPTTQFSGDNETSVITTKMQSGKTRQRRQFTKELRTYKVSWEMSDFEFGMFQSWFLYKLSDGADMFTIDLPTGGDLYKTVNATFIGGKYSFSHKEVMFWNVTGSLQVEEPDVWTPDIYDLLLSIGDPDALELDGTTLHTLIHTTFPSYF